MTEKEFIRSREAEWHYKMLLFSLRYHKFRYYVMDDPILTDSEYDSLERQFANACDALKKWPHIYEALGKPEVWVDSTDYPGMERVAHPWIKGEAK